MELIRKRIAISLLPVLRCPEKLKLEGYLDTSSDLFRCTRRDLEYLTGCRIPPGLYRRRETLNMLEAAEKAMQRHRIRAVHITDRAYPPLLRHIYDPPYLLYVQGAVPDFSKLTVALFGSSRPGRDACTAAEQAGRETAESGHVLAVPYLEGISRIALDSCLRSSGSAVAILQGGCTGVGTASTLSYEGGTVLCEHPYGISDGFAFLRIAAGISHALLCIEAPAGGMTRLVAGYALDEGRELAVHSQGMGAPGGSGGNMLAEEGADVLSSIQELAVKVSVSE